MKQKVIDFIENLISKLWRFTWTCFLIYAFITLWGHTMELSQYADNRISEEYQKVKLYNALHKTKGANEKASYQ
jgi:hypothetical protein